MFRTKSWQGKSRLKPIPNTLTGSMSRTIIRRNRDVNGRGGLKNTELLDPKIRIFSHNAVDSQFGLA